MRHASIVVPVLASLLAACSPAGEGAGAERLDAPAVAGSAGQPEREASLSADPGPLGALRANVAETAARPEHGDERVQVAHVLVAFEGAERSRVVGRTKGQAEERAAEVLRRVTSGGEDFLAVMKEMSDDPGPGVYTMWLHAPQGEGYPRGQMAPAFGDTGWRLAPGEIGVAAWDATKSPFGWHVIKRVE